MPEATHDAPFTGDDLDTALGRILNTFEYPSKTQAELDALSYDANKRIIFYNSTNDYLVQWTGSAWAPWANVSTPIHVADARGTGAIDLQANRNADTQVASGDYASLTGGRNNTASGDYSHAAGDTTTASGEGAQASGKNTTASGAQATATGRSTTASGDYSVATGRDSAATLTGQQAWSSGGFSNISASAQATRLVAYTTTTNATPAGILLSGSTPLVLEDDHLYYIHASVLVTSLDASQGAAYDVRGMVRRGTGANSVALVGTPITTTDFESQAGWDVTLVADTTNGAVTLQATGAAATTLRWVACIDWTQIGY